MALPTLDATFASSADLPRKQMLAKWLIGELGSGSIAEYCSLPERYLWAKIAVAAGGPKTEADYISLPKNYVWSDIYNAVSGDIANSTVVVSGLSDTSFNGSYVYDGDFGGRPSYRLNSDVSLYWDAANWALYNIGSGFFYISNSDVIYPWLATGWLLDASEPSVFLLTPQTPNHTDWSENVALGHIAAAYRGDTGNPANLATYIDWPWRYKVASIIDHLIGNYNAVIVSGAGYAPLNGTFTKRGIFNGKPYYNLIGSPDNIDSNSIIYDGSIWVILSFNDGAYYASSANVFPWNATWIAEYGDYDPPPTLTPTNV